MTDLDFIKMRMNERATTSGRPARRFRRLPFLRATRRWFNEW